VDTLKIDQSFVRNILTDEDDATIALAVISLAHSLRMRVIAEGVETAEQCNLLRLNRCDEIQGYYFSRPVPAAEMAAMLQANKRLIADD
jgi:EAL domain-containing protein (putative c-di-GMP-specific phosphodiesterase class I)